MGPGRPAARRAAGYLDGNFMSTRNAGLISIRINTDKCDSKLMTKGKRGVWLGCVLVPTPDSEFGNSHLVAQEVSKEDRLNGIRGPIIGNAKIFGPAL